MVLLLLELAPWYGKLEDVSRAGLDSWKVEDVYCAGADFFEMVRMSRAQMYPRFVGPGCGVVVVV